eukprot:COSAG06_NODE_9056_length_2001_cov_1.386961_1_plen_147_part_10
MSQYGPVASLSALKREREDQDREPVCRLLSWRLLSVSDTADYRDVQDTYVDVRSASLNRWSLKQAQYVLSRQRFAQLAGRKTHFPALDGGYKFSGKYEDFFTGDGSTTEDTEKNLGKSTLDEERSTRLVRAEAGEPAAEMGELGKRM